MTRNTGRSTSRTMQEQTTSVVVTQDGAVVSEASVPSLTTDLQMPNLTVEWARRTDLTVADAEAFQRQATTVRTALGDVDEALAWQLGLAVHGAVASGLIAKGKRWERQDDYAAEITDGRGKGYSKGAVSKAATIGGAAVRHGLTYRSDEYRALRQALSADLGTAEERKAVLAAARGEDSDLFRKATAMWNTKREEERQAVAQREAQRALDGASGDTSGESSSGDSGETREAHGANLQVIEPEGSAPREMRPTVEDCRVVLAGLQEKLHRMSPAEQDEVFATMYDLVAECEARREALGDVPAEEPTA